MSKNEVKLYTYASTILVFKHCADGVLDLRTPLSEHERGLLLELGLDSPFAVLTAYNPYGENEHPANEERQEGLRSALIEEVQRVVLLDGCSPDRTHREPSIAVCIPEHRAREIALQFQQDAFFWFDGDSFYLVGAGEPLGRVKLPFSGEIRHAQHRDIGCES